MKAAFYTAIFGDKNELPTIQNYQKSDDFHFLCFTDNENLKSDIYEIVYVKPCLEDITKNARKIKILGFEKDHKYDYIIWHDANISVDISNINELIYLTKNYQYSFYKHSKRNCSYKEILTCIDLKKDYSLRMFFHSINLFFRGLSNNQGLFETGFFIKNNTLRNKKFEKDWWKNVRRLSRRDQVSLPINIIKHNIKYNTLPSTIYNSEFISLDKHKHNNYKDRSWFRIFEGRISRSISYRGVSSLIKINLWLKRN